MRHRAWPRVAAVLLGLICGCSRARAPGPVGPPPVAIGPGTVLLRTPHSSHASETVAVSPDGRLVAMGRCDWTPDGVAPESRGAVAVILDAATGAEVATIRGAIGSDACPVAFAPDGQSLAVGMYDSIRLFDPATGQLRRELGDGSWADGAMALAFAPDGRTLAGVAFPANLVLWDLTSGRAAEPIDIRSRDADAVAFAPDGRTVVAAGPGPVRCTAEPSLFGWRALTGWGPIGQRAGPGVARLIDLDARTERARLLHGDRARSATFAPDGRTLATAGGTAKVWDLATNEARTLYDPMGDAMPAAAVAFAPGGGTLAIGLGGRNFRGPTDAVRLHDVATGRCRAVLRWDLGPVRSVAFAPDGRWLVAAGPAGVARWDLDATEQGGAADAAGR